jgi:biopolymer transport protein ExbD
MAGGAREDDGGGAIYNINVTPLVDITLVLLIIMMVTAKIIMNQGMPMDVPRATKTDQALQDMLMVGLKQDGGIKIGDREVTGEREKELLRAAKEAKARQDDIRAVIRAEKKAPHGNVIRVLDLLKQAGIQKVAFAPPVESLDPKPLDTK